MTSEFNAGNTGRMPVLFVGHGSPMNAIEDNEWSRGFRALAELLPRPRAVLSISAHWFVEGSFVTDNQHPKTIHDFGGFPRPLYEIEYPAAGDLDLAKRIAHLAGEGRVSLRSDWGIDHGTWTVLQYLLPKADVPVVQLSIDENLSPAGHLELGHALGSLRDEGVLIMGSGNITHNLRHAFTSMRTGDSTTPEWAAQFDRDIAQAVEQHDHAFLAKALDNKAGHISHPTPDHYFPLLYTVGASETGDRIEFPITGFDLGSLSMRSILIK